MAMELNALCELMGIDTRPVGVYDAPDPGPFAPLASPGRCIFDSYRAWQMGETLDIAHGSPDCRGCGYWMAGIESFPSREAFINFLTVDEGLRSDPRLTEAWLEKSRPYSPEHEHVLIGPVQPEMEKYLKTVTFFVRPDELSVLVLGANHHAHPDDPAPVLAPFGSGCSQMLAIFPDLGASQAVIGATDIAMRSQLPSDRLAFTVTVPMLERLLSLDPEGSFLGKPFLKRLRKARTKG